ncbi:MAG: helix-turn-helix domain-containing protein [Ignavibacterium sp.]|uniref:helix-turn-helix domain-containing protein n=1 Tax=Ignavibacterium album TaxID=591197 RepID=UPI0026ED9DF4|nr:helix-turn-helix domain-containing protein [Ignavibacterium album]MCA2004216.1 helix-turn-helix domain-containing protein [Ignavibacterium sp.]MCX8105237.1 helix-turn-helix domain-containing protein [Ignavibacterium album]
MLDKFAEELREQREKSGITIQQIAAKTRIDKKFLEAIDQGNFSFLPELYVKAFIKEYAVVIGLDGEETVKKFLIAREGKDYNEVLEQEKLEKEKAKEQKKSEIPQPKPSVTTAPVKSYYDESLNKKESDDSDSDKTKLMYAAVAGLVVLVVAILYIFVFNKTDEIIVEETPIEEIVSDNTQRFEEEPLNNNETNSITNSDSLLFEIFSSETTWVNIIPDDEKAAEFILYPNSSRKISAQNSIAATVGNSGGVTLKLNNKQIEFSGRAKSVRHFRIDKTGKLEYLNTPPKTGQ